MRCLIPPLSIAFIRCTKEVALEGLYLHVCVNKKVSNYVSK